MQHVEITPVPAGLSKNAEVERALHFEINAVGTAGRRARAAVAVGFLLLAPGKPGAELPGSIRICRAEKDCAEGTAKPPLRRYWREASE